MMKMRVLEVGVDCEFVGEALMCQKASEIDTLERIQEGVWLRYARVGGQPFSWMPT